MDGDQDAPLGEAPLVSLRFIFRNANADQGARNASNDTPTPSPARVAIIGPAAMKGPSPGNASAPIPANHPKAPPIRTPEPAPAVAPSGAFVDFSVIRSLGPRAFRGTAAPTTIPPSSDSISNDPPASRMRCRRIATPNPDGAWAGALKFSGSGSITPDVVTPTDMLVALAPILMQQPHPIVVQPVD